MRRVQRWWFLMGTAVLAAAVMTTGMPAADATPFPPEPLEPRRVIEKAPFAPPANGFDWRAPSRFGRDDNRDGLIDYHWNDLDDDAFPGFDRPPEHGGPPETYDPEWVHPETFPIEFDACPTQEEAAKSDAATATANTYTWVIDGQPSGARPDCRLLHPFEDQGVHTVSLTVAHPDGTTDGPHVQEVLVRDLLIVSIGDSYGSGEGNPDIEQVLAGSTVVRAAQWEDKRCHRSAHAGAAQAARRLEGSDPKTSVTFLSFACSGATIDTMWGTDDAFPYAPPKGEEVACVASPDSGTRQNCPIGGTGILGPYKGVDRPPGVDYLATQLEQLKTAVTNPKNGSVRTIDSLVISGGGNDAGFASVATVCVLWFDHCQDAGVDPIGGGEKVKLAERFAQDLGSLPGKYDKLEKALDQMGLPIARSYVTEYPGSTTGDDGGPCKAVLDDVLHPNPLLAAGALSGLLGLVFGVVGLVFAALGTLWSQTRSMADDEVVWAGNTVAPGINEMMRQAAEKNRWTYVGGIGEKYVGHGYCASDSYIRRAPEASVVQGPYGPPEQAGIHSRTKGTLHPNTSGYYQYANQLAPLLADQFQVGSGRAEFTMVERAGDQESRHGRAGWLTGRCPVGSADCTSDAAVVAVEARDPGGIKGAEVTVDGAPGCPADLTCTAELVDPLTYRWTFAIARDGIRRLGFSVSNKLGYLSTSTREVKVDLHDPTASTTLESLTAPTGLRFAGNDGRGAGVDQIAFEGLWHGNAPGSTAPGQTVAIDLGGRYDLRFRAIDEAGRAGPWQAQLLTLGGPTMSGSADDPGSGARAQASQDCTQFPDEDTNFENRVGTGDTWWYDGLPVALLSPRTHADAVPARLALAARGEAERRDGSFPNGGNEDCDADTRLDKVPFNVGAGTSGLAPGEPVKLQATFRLAGALAESPDSSSDSGTYTEGQSYFHITDPTAPGSLLADFRAKAERTIYVGPTYKEHDLTYGHNVWSNLEPAQEGRVTDRSIRRGPFRLPVEEWTITFETRVGARSLVEGGLDIFASARGNPGTRVSSESDFATSLDIKPAPGFEGVEVIHGDPQPNRPPDAVDDSVEVDDGTAMAIDVLANDSDVDSDVLRVTEVSRPSHGTAVIGADGRVTYTTGEDFGGRDSFAYTVADGKGGTGTATVRIRATGTKTRAADFDGDGDSDLSVFRLPAGVWFVRDGATTEWGTAGDIAVPGDYDRDGDTDMAVFRPSNGIWFVKGGPTLAWGTEGDIPVPGDYDGDGTADVAVFRPSTGTWFVRDGGVTQWGTAGDVPVPGDYDGDGTTELAVYRPSTGTWFARDGATTQWGTAGDVPVPGDYDGDGAADVAVFRPGEGIWFVRDDAATQWGTAGDDALPLAPAVRSMYFPSG